MQKCVLAFVSTLALMVPAAQAAVNISAPGNGATVQSPVHFSATAGGTSCWGVASMGIYTAPGVLAYVTGGTILNTDLNLAPGTYNATFIQWDFCGGAITTPISFTVTNSAGVHVISPASNSTVGSPVHFQATATTGCPKGVGAMGIYTGPYQKAYTVGGANLNTDLPLSPGTYNTTIVEWDNCGGAASAQATVSVGGKTFANLQASGGWGSYGEYPPNYNICSNCGGGVTWWMNQHVSNPSLSGNASQFGIGGNTPYSDVLWNNHLIGDGSTQGLPDSDRSLTPSIHNFTYDTYFFGGDLSLAENIEFDIAQFFNNTGYYFGTQCQILDGQVWGVWDNVNAKWIPTGIPCKPNSNAWNHVVIQFERTSDNRVLYKSFTLNGVTQDLNWSYPPYYQPGWYGVVLNFQLDGNYKQSPYNVYLDNFNVSYY